VKISHVCMYAEAYDVDALVYRCVNI